MFSKFIKVLQNKISSMNLLLNSAICLLVASSIAATDYCKLDCRGTQNVACNSPYANGGWGKNCKNQELFKITQEYQQAIVDVHNKYRNLQALGNITNYSTAVRMAKMRWDPDLAYTAEMNVRSCVFAHDACHKTEKYSVAGQNIAMTVNGMNWDRKITPSQVADRIMEGWFNEYKNGGSHGWMDMINDLKSSNFDSSKPVVGHFTQWVQDKAEAVGCAAIMATMTYSGKEGSAFLLTCNYSYGNMLGSPVYVAGKTASKCTTGSDATYRGLCSEKENFSY